MATYLIISLPFITAILLLDLIILKTRVVKTNKCWVVMAIIIAMTTIADQLLTGLPIVEYNQAKILGIKLGHLPIEDFMYAVAAVIGLGSLTEYYEQRQS